MTKISIMLAAILMVAGYSHSYGQTISRGGHTYVAIPAMSLADAESTVVILGGHLITVDSEEEYRFLDTYFIKRGMGWWWTGTAASFEVPGYPSGTWVNNGDEWSHYVSVTGRSHWNTTKIGRVTYSGQLLKSNN